LLSPGEKLPKGFELVRSSTNRSASGILNNFGVLAFKRSEAANPFLSGEELIDDICILSNEEEIPDGYTEIEKNGQHNHHAAQINHFFAYHVVSEMGICDLKYESSTLDRYPLEVNILY
jgi:hypothetical protein